MPCLACWFWTEKTEKFITNTISEIQIANRSRGNNRRSQSELNAVLFLKYIVIRCFVKAVNFLVIKFWSCMLLSVPYLGWRSQETINAKESGDLQRIFLSFSESLEGLWLSFVKLQWCNYSLSQHWSTCFITWRFINDVNCSETNKATKVALSTAAIFFCRRKNTKLSWAVLLPGQAKVSFSLCTTIHTLIFTWSSSWNKLLTASTEKTQMRR